MNFYPDSMSLREANDCHDPENGQFTFKGRGRCLGLASRKAARAEHNRRRVLGPSASADARDARLRQVMGWQGARNDAATGNQFRSTERGQLKRDFSNVKVVGKTGLPMWINRLPKYLRKDALDAWKADRAVSAYVTSIGDFDRDVTSPGVSYREPKVAVVAKNYDTTYRWVTDDTGNERLRAVPKMVDVWGKDEILSTFRHELGHIDKTPMGRGGDRLFGVTFSPKYTEEMRAWKNAIRNSKARVDWPSVEGSLRSYMRSEVKGWLTDEPQKTIKGQMARHDASTAGLQSMKDALTDRLTKAHVRLLRRYARRVKRASV